MVDGDVISQWRGCSVLWTFESFPTERVAAYFGQWLISQWRVCSVSWTVASFPSEEISACCGRWRHFPVKRFQHVVDGGVISQWRDCSVLWTVVSFKESWRVMIRIISVVVFFWWKHKVWNAGRFTLHLIRAILFKIRLFMFVCLFGWLVGWLVVVVFS